MQPVNDPVSSILRNKGSETVSVRPETSVYQALAVMAEKSIGAVLVMNGQRLEGIFTERDYARKVILHGRSSKETLVAEVMVSPPISVGPSDTVDDCMRLMTEHRIRHLPVMDGASRVVGILSIGDLVNWVIRGQQEHIEELQHYIAGAYPR